MSRWRTQAFERLNTPLDRVVGDKTAKAFVALRVHSVGDLLRHVPRRHVSGTDQSDFADLQIDEYAAVLARIKQLKAEGSVPKLRLTAVLADQHGATMTATFFTSKPQIRDGWQRKLSVSNQGIFVGKVGSYRDQLQLVHPHFAMLDTHGQIVSTSKDASSDMVAQVGQGGLIGLYPQTSALPTWVISSSVQLALDWLGDAPDPLPDQVRERFDLPDLVTAFRLVHAPADRVDPEHGMRRLRFDEALGLTLAMGRRREVATREDANPLRVRPGGAYDAFASRLPFTLTAGQRQVVAEIDADLERGHPMQRLLQGEVGSGKTVVALLAMLRAVDAGAQAVLMAPTEVLAVQHAESVRAMLGDLADGGTLDAPAEATRVVLLTGSMPAAARRAALEGVASGEAGIVIGTHAVLSEKVEFADLGLVVVDEQHRFGVEQRAQLGQRGRRPHVLVMTATPIPRSVAMTVFGDLSVSTLTEIPAGRADVQTTVIRVREHPTWIERAWQRVSEEVAAGRQAFVVCPRIAESDSEVEGALGAEDPEGEKLPPPAAVEPTAERLANGPLSQARVGILHGRLSAEDKDQTMAAFAAGDIDVLVATTVVEVGVDVPNATVMVVLDADRFGISQLHQLRGRIGRGAHPGLCLLTSQASADAPATQRLATVASTRDGFALAEADLAARREGNVLGASQSGVRSSLRLLRVLDHAEVINAAREVADELVARYPVGTEPGIDDYVAQTEQVAAGEWLERS